VSGLLASVDKDDDQFEVSLALLLDAVEARGRSSK